MLLNSGSEANSLAFLIANIHKHKKVVSLMYLIVFTEEQKRLRMFQILFVIIIQNILINLNITKYQKLLVWNKMMYFNYKKLIVN